MIWLMNVSTIQRLSYSEQESKKKKGKKARFAVHIAYTPVTWKQVQGHQT